MDDSQLCERLVLLIDRLRKGDDVAARDLRNALSDHQFKDYEVRWEEQRSLRQESKNKPPAVLQYEIRLKKAHFEYSKADNLSRKRSSSGVGQITKESVTKAVNRAESLFESLLEFLEEQVTLDPGLQIWFDRPIVFGPAGSLSPNPDSVPRVVTSQSRERQGEGLVAGTQRKREIKLAVLEAALQDLREQTERRRLIEVRLAQEQASTVADDLKSRLKSARRR